MPETVTYGAVLLVAMMIFSIYVHVDREYSPRQVPWPVVLGALAVILGLLYAGSAVGPLGELFRAWIR